MQTAAKADVRFRVRVPSLALRPFVKEFRIIESTSPRSQILIPETAPLLGIRWSGICTVDDSSSLPTVLVSGMQDSVRTVAHFGDSHMLLVRFTETGAAAFLREPMDFLSNTTAALDSFVAHSRVNRFEEQIGEAREDGARVEVVENFLLELLPDGAPDALLTAAVARIKQTGGLVRIEQLARQIGLSQSAIERRFRRTIGASPKRFASIVRLRHAVKLWRAGRTLTEIAHHAGYFDQSHFIRDVKRFAAQAPEAFFARLRFW